MRKHFFDKRIVLGVAVAFTVTSSLSLITSLNSDSLGTNTLFPKSSDFSVVAEASSPAADAEFVLSGSAITVDSSGVLTAFNSSSLNAIKSQPGVNTIKLTFDPSLNIKKIANNVFSGLLEDRKYILELPETLEEIGEKAFEQDLATYNANLGITGILNLPSSLKKLGGYAFRFNNIDEVTFPNDIEVIGSCAFEHNRVRTINWGNYNKVNTTVRDSEHFDITNSSSAGIVIPTGLFSYNELESVTIPDNVVTIGESAFSLNKINADINIPASVVNIYHNAFYGNNYDKKINFAPDGSCKVEYIGNHAFYNTGFKGEFIIPASVRYITDCAFMGNKITVVDFNGNKPMVGSEAFAENPLVSVKRLNIGFGSDNMSNNKMFQSSVGKSLKNVSFDYANLDSNFKTLTQSVFNKGSLRSIELPSTITDIKFPTYQFGNAFSLNKGWYDGTTKVALYRVDSTKKYVMDNSIADGAAYVFNPVLLEFSFVDKEGNNLSGTLLPASVNRERDNYSITPVNNIDYTNYKLGDKITFKLTGTLPEGYVLAAGIDSKTQLTPGADGTYEITLNPDDTKIVQTVSYGDDYEVGYKKTLISLVKASDLTKPESPKADENTPNGNNGGDKDKKKDNTKEEQPKDNGNKPETKKDNGSKDNKDQPKKDNTDSNNGGSQETPDRRISTDNNDNGGTTNQISNPGAIPNDGAVFNLVDENGNPLGKAVLDKDKGTYTLIDDDGRTPQGVAKIHKDKTLEVLKVFDGKTPLGTLPRTGGSNESVFVILGAALIGLGVTLRKKFR